MKRNQKILIVDDRPENLLALEMVLGETGAEIIKAESGNEALSASLNHEFALAILDVLMPGMDGYELAELLRNEEKTRSLPIIFLSAVYSDDYHVFRGYDAGAVDFITKPYHPKVLLSKVNVFLQLDRQRMELLEMVELEKSKKYLETVLMSMIDPVIILSPEGAILDVNKAARSLFGCKEEPEMLGAPIHQFVESKEDSPFPPSTSSTTTAAEPDFVNKNVFIKTGVEGGIPALVSGSTFRDEEGKVLGTALVVRDITDRKRMEEALKDYMHRLEQSNRDLQEFTAVASHDLQEPLRKIKTFGDLVVSKHGKNLSDEALGFIERMRNAADRMQILMDSLLTYSRVTTKAEPFSRVNLNKVVQNVLSDLEWRIKQTGAIIEVKDLGTVEAEPNQMNHLFQNLLSNALKFQNAEKPIIKVFSKQHRSRPRNSHEQGFCRIFVEDNGIGFEEKDLDRIFAPFQRLHARNKYEGTGIGLAICKKIVERHRGLIQAWSSPGHGSTFIVTLPLRQDREECECAPPAQLSLYS